MAQPIGCGFIPDRRGRNLSRNRLETLGRTAGIQMRGATPDSCSPLGLAAVPKRRVVFGCLDTSDVG
eukprot:9369415-Pyramimonas_sp.AAC.1